MKTIIFSDTHLTKKFDERLYKFLKSIISSADRVIINGDFWDYYFTTFNIFINSKWNQLFPLLEARNTTYIYGNHDKATWCHNMASCFSKKQCRKIKLKAGKKKIIITHGDIFSPGIEEYIESPLIQEFVNEKLTSFEELGKKFMGEFYRLGAISNIRMKKFCKISLESDEILVCGHSHVPEFNISEKFINIGANLHGFGNFLLIENDKLISVNERY